MTRYWCWRAIGRIAASPAALCGWAMTGDAQAHAFAAPYRLPVPFWMYAYGSAAALVVSFLIVGLFATAPAHNVPGPLAQRTGDTWRRLPQGVVTVVRLAAVLALMLCIVSGLAGTQNPFQNINMTLFWIVFAVGLTYTTAAVGDVFGFSNPWRTLCDIVDGTGLIALKGRYRYPTCLSWYPALFLYFGFIWIELFGHTTPRSLSVILIAYTVLTVLGAWLFGTLAWFRHGEFFAVFFRLVGLMAPVDYREDGRAVSFRLRLPLAGLLERRKVDTSLVLFVLFMLASTAFDGAHETLPWSSLFWKNVYPWIEPAVMANSAQPYKVAASIFYMWQWLMLALSPAVYFGLYFACIWMNKLMSGGKFSARELGWHFSLSLVPIAFVYHLTHYYTLLPSQASQLARMVSDPLGRGWNLFGTADMQIPPTLLDASVIWHSQVALILAGHIASVFLAHIEALRIFPSQRRAVYSQLPMLLLMVMLTAGGLWILSLPMAPG